MNSRKIERIRTAGYFFGGFAIFNAGVELIRTHCETGFVLATLGILAVLLAPKLPVDSGIDFESGGNDSDELVYYEEDQSHFPE